MKRQSRQCTARRKDGRLCRSWALRDGDEALCASHGRARHGEASHGEASHREASHEEASHREASHGEARQQRRAEAVTPGFYDDAYDLAEAADLLYETQAKNLADELNVTRVAVRHALLQLKQELDPAQYARIINLIFKGTRTIADIIRVQRSVSPDDGEPFPPGISEVLDEVLAMYRDDS